MLHIILFLLKIIGIILASLLAIFLLLIGLILFVPVRYRAKGERGEKLFFYFIGSWLCHILHVSIQYDGDNPIIKLRIAGIPIFDNTREKKERKKKRIKSKLGEEELDKNTVETQELIHTLELNPKTDETVHTLEIEQKGDIISKTNSEEQNIVPYELEEKENEQNKKQNKEKGFFSKLIKKVKEILLLIKETYFRILELISNIQETIKRIIDTSKLILKKISTVKDFISEDENKEGFNTVFGTAIHILKKIGPAKIKGRLYFGTGDPCSTGQILAALGALYGMNIFNIGDSVTIEPDFEKAVLEGDLFIKGRFRLISLLIIGIKMLRDKKFKTFKKNIYNLKEEL